MSNISVPSVGEVIRGRIAELGISQTELAARVGEHFQTISAIINGKREATISLSVRIDEALDLPSGTIALAQTRYLVSKEISEKDAVIEAALVHLDLEDLPLLLGIWSKAHIKRVWKERLVSQGKRMNIRNYTLAVKFLEIRNPEEYLKRNAKFHKW